MCPYSQTTYLIRIPNKLSNQMKDPKFKHGYGAVCAILTCLSTACMEAPQEKVEAVAQVGEEVISRTELEEFAAALLPGLRSKKGGQEARRDYVRTLIDEKLLVLEARAQGLDTTGSFTTGLEQSYRAHVVQYYRAQHLHPQIEISNAQLRDRFVEDGFDRERALQRLLVTTAEEADRLREQVVVDGADFAELARTYSLDKRTAPGGGHTGFVNALWASRFEIPRQLFDSLPSGEVSQTLPLRDVYQLIVFGKDREADFAAGMVRVRNSIMTERMTLLRRAAAEELALRFGLSVNDGGLEILLTLRPQSGSPIGSELSSEEEVTPLYVFDEGGEITVDEYLDAFRGAGRRPGLGDSLEVVRAAWKHVVPEVMFWEDARRRGYDELASMLEWKERETTDRLIKALRREAVSEQVVVSDEEAEQFYRDNPRLFQEPETVTIQEVLVDDADEAAELRRRLDSGEDMDALVHLSRRPGAEEKQGKWHLHASQKQFYGDLAEQAFGARVEQVVGPVETGDGHSVFRVLAKSGGELLPFPDVAERAAATLRYREESRLFNVLVGAVRETHVDQVQIFEEELSTVQLPAKDALSTGVKEQTIARLRRMAQRHFAEGEYSKAVAAYERALRLDSLQVDAQRNIGIAYQRMGNIEESITALHSALRIDSTFIQTYYDLALAYAHEKDFEAAFAVMDRALRIEPGSADTYRLLAFFHSAREQFDQAEEALSMAVAVDERSVGAWRELGTLYRQQGRSEEAEAPLLRAVELDPDDKEAWNELGGLYADVGRSDEADASLRRALEIDPEYAKAHYNLSQLLSAQGKVEEAQSMLDRFNSLSADDR